ncbi:hypothetical protein MTR_8g075820 [Medicago truncatula]|uniref:Uncharacterized protein n=1 Tax=Medicago truncatula TaxID=3880 RepID=G7LC45_MEDTR|nr:hypothetical protein MTR_8g075820 [Medicago truncatula]
MQSAPLPPVINFMAEKRAKMKPVSSVICFCQTNMKDGGKKTKVRGENQVFVRFRLSDQLRSSADPTNDFGVINVADPEAWLFQRF